MNYRSDLAIESIDSNDGQLPEGVEVKESTKDGVTLTYVRVKTKAAAKRIGRSVGAYYTLEGNLADNGESFVQPLKEVLSQLLPKGNVMVVGLGNPALTPDTVGTCAADGVFATGHLEESLLNSLKIDPQYRVTAIAPNVTGQTGIPSAQIVSSVVNTVNPDCLIVVDSFAARSPGRLGNTIQVADSGIAPGSGVGGGRWEISKESLGIPVISVGVPTIIDTNTLMETETSRHPMMVTPSNIDIIAKRGGDVIAMGINLALFPSLDEDTIRYLTM